tara:strand:+ start:937 stop:1314 length:378 start_codon:yes stop_codon:yes gene_type:complete
MAYYATINVVAGDSKPEVNLTLKDRNTAAGGSTLDPDDSATWALIDITDPTIVVKFRLLGGTSVLDTMTCIKIAPFANGACYMPWNATTLDVAAGTYEGEIELTYTNGKILTIFDRLKFKVRADF